MGGGSDRTGGCGRGRKQDFSEGVLKVRPHTKSGGGGGGSPLQVRYTKSGGGGGGGSPLQVRYLCLAHKKYVIVNNKQLQF